jgi:SAM-dependent methyltransferase
MKHGDFTGLAESYSKFRPAYAPSVRDAVLGMFDRPADTLDGVDVGAGTGIWTRMLAARLRSVTAVEPNDDMRAAGIRDSVGTNIVYRAGSGERTGLDAGSADLLSMASSFHWVDFDKGIAEFHRVLRPKGRVLFLWNPRLIEANPLLVEIEAKISALRSDVKRLSSGSSGMTETLTENLWRCGKFDDVVYLEGRHVVGLTPQQYLGVWKSVNDVQVQLGPEKWAEFLAFVKRKTAGLDVIEATYRTRAWTARRIG